jgi:hypothetical protein
VLRSSEGLFHDRRVTIEIVITGLDQVIHLVGKKLSNSRIVSTTLAGYSGGQLIDSGEELAWATRHPRHSRHPIGVPASRGLPLRRNRVRPCHEALDERNECARLGAGVAGGADNQDPERRGVAIPEGATPPIGLVTA